MTVRRLLPVLGLLTALVLSGCSSGSTDDTPSENAGTGTAAAGTIVTRENFVRAETDRTFAQGVQVSGGVNKYFHIRRVTPIDEQIVPRMNRDTLYSAAVIDTSEGGTITLPASPDGRYVSMHLIDNDHYDLGVKYDAGTYDLPKDVGFISAAVRIQVLDPNDADEIAMLNKWQDTLTMDVPGETPFVSPNWDAESREAVRLELDAEALTLPNLEKAMKPRGEADPQQWLVSAACCWGLLPAEAATYILEQGGHPITECRTATYDVPKNEAFWSIQVYNGKGFIDSDNSSLNKNNVKLNPDGTFTVYFGSEELCGDVPNRLDVSEGWNFQMRVYRPDASVLGGGYVLPEVTVVTAN